MIYLSLIAKTCKQFTIDPLFKYCAALFIIIAVELIFITVQFNICSGFATPGDMEIPGRSWGKKYYNFNPSTAPLEDFQLRPGFYFILF